MSRLLRITLILGMLCSIAPIQAFPAMGSPPNQSDSKSINPTSQISAPGVLGQPAAAQVLSATHTADYSISGRVTDGLGAGIEGVTVEVIQNKIFLPAVQTVAGERQTISPVSQPAIQLTEPSAVTDADGYYTIPDLAEGHYRLVARLDGIPFTPAEQIIELPGTGTADFQVEIIDPKIPDTTTVLPETTGEFLESISSDGSVLTYTQSTPDLELLNPGDVLLSDVIDEAPDGLLRKVVSVSHQDGKVVVTTEPAALEEAVEAGSVYNEIQLAPADVAQVTTLPGVQTMSPASSDSPNSFYLNIPLEAVIYDLDGDPKTPMDQVHIKGSISFDLETQFYLNIQNWRVEWLTLANTTRNIQTLEIFAGTELKYEPDPILLATYNFNPVTVWLGWVPVVLAPKLNVYVGLEGKIAVGLTTGITNTTSSRAGISYTATGGWNPFFDITNDFEFEPPHATLEASVEVFIEFRFHVLLYKAVGPYVAVKPFLELVIQPLEDPFWELFGGVKIPMGFAVEKTVEKILKLEPCALLELGLKVSIDRAISDNTAPYVAETVSPAADALDQDINIDLQWSGSDPDEDPLNYEVYFGSTNPPPLVTYRQNAETFDPGPLILSTEYFWKIVTWDEHGLSTASPIWKFTTLNSPPAAPSNPSPGMGAQNQPLYTTLAWQPNGDPDPGDWMTYTLYLSTAYPPTTIVSTDQTDTDYQTGKLLPITTHYWRVVARDNHGATATSPIWNFTTGDPVVPGEMVLIPAGNFQMGCDSAHDGGYDGCGYVTQPVHTVYLDYYRIDRFEVTNAMYAECVSAGACTPPHWTGSATRESYYGNPTYFDYPVIQVSWYDASNYCTWAGKRLPTEAEWEKAARGSGDTRPFPWGERTPDCTLANIWPQWYDFPCFGDTTPVGNYPDGASPYGVMDMIGNIIEWVSDWYDGNYYSFYPPEAWPPNPAGPDTGVYRSIRGGPFFSSQSLAYRNALQPDRYSWEANDLGFRCAANVGND